MALDVAFARPALRDLEELLDYISIEDEGAAVRMVERIEKSVQLLSHRPFIGPPAPRTGEPDMRKMSVPPFVVFYRVRGDELQVARVLHSSMDMTVPDLFGD